MTFKLSMMTVWLRGMGHLPNFLICCKYIFFYEIKNLVSWNVKFSDIFIARLHALLKQVIAIYF